VAAGTAGSPARLIRAGPWVHSGSVASTCRARVRQAYSVSMEVLFASVPASDLKATKSWHEQLVGRAPDIVPNEKPGHVEGGVSRGHLSTVNDPNDGARYAVTSDAAAERNRYMDVARPVRNAFIGWPRNEPVTVPKVTGFFEVRSSPDRGTKSGVEHHPQFLANDLHR
jgi:hypothetical protein